MSSSSQGPGQAHLSNQGVRGWNTFAQISQSGPSNASQQQRPRQFITSMEMSQQQPPRQSTAPPRLSREQEEYALKWLTYHDNLAEARKKFPTRYQWQQYVQPTEALVAIKDVGGNLTIKVLPLDGVRITFAIEGGTDLPAFSLQLKAKTSTGKEIIMKAYYLMWNKDKTTKPRCTYRNSTGETVNCTPSELPFGVDTGIAGAKWNFSRSLHNVMCRELPSAGLTAASGYHHWDRYNSCYYKSMNETRNPIGIEFDTHTACISFNMNQPLNNLGLSAVQLTQINNFRSLQRKNAHIDLTLVWDWNLLYSWKFFCAAPIPTPLPFSRYEPLPDESRGFTINEIPTLSSFNIVSAHFAQRPQGWTASPDAQLIPPFHIISMPDAQKYFLHERHYEMVGSIGLHRETEAAIESHSTAFDRDYVIKPIPADILRPEYGSSNKYYVFVNVRPDNDTNDADLSPPKINSPVYIKPASARNWNDQIIAHVVESPREETDIYDICLLSTLNTSQSGVINDNVTVSIKFGTFNPPSRDFDRAIRYTMYGNISLGISSNSFLKDYVLGRGMRSLGDLQQHAYYRNISPDYFTGDANPRQREAIETALKFGSNLRARFTLIEAGPGTGKTFIIKKILQYCLKNGLKSLVFATSHFAINEVADRLEPNEGQIFKIARSLEETIDSVVDATGEDDEDDDYPADPENPQSVLTQAQMELLNSVGVKPLEAQLLLKDLKSRLSLKERHSLSAYILKRLSLESVARENQENKLIDEFWKARTLAWSSAVPLADELEDQSQLFGSEDPHKKIRNTLRACWLHLCKYYVSKASVVLCTSAAAARKIMRWFRPKFCIGEEAGQMKDRDVLNAMIRFQGQNSECVNFKCVLIGDGRQLKPYLGSADRNEVANFEILSLLQRLLNLGVPSISLNRQYRMHRDIAAFPIKEYYNNGIVTDDSCNGRQGAKRFRDFLSRWLFPHANNQNSIKAQNSVFLSINKSVVYQPRKGTSLVNFVYVDAMGRIATALVNQYGFKSNQIMLLTFYNAELKLLRRWLKDMNLPNVGTGLVSKDVVTGSVDSQQGHEADIVILSTTRTGKSQRVGFMGDSGRQVVALTRARDGLIILGNEHIGDRPTKGTWAKGWGNLLEHHRERQALIKVSMNADTLQRQLGVPGADYNIVPGV
jgi:hypothetical protein